MFIFGYVNMNNLKSALLIVIVSLCLCWGSSLAVGNTFVRRLLGTQLEIWLNQRSNVWEFRDWKSGNSLTLQQEVISQNRFDLVAELDKAKTEQERLVIIDQYINSLNNTISNWQNLWSYEQSQVDYYKSEVKKCEEPIKSKNSEFSEAVKNYNYERAEAISKDIAELRACVARNEFYAKAHASYASSSKSLNTLQKRVDYLSKNREKIAKYYEILKPDLLKELYDISKTVEDLRD